MEIRALQVKRNELADRVREIASFVKENGGKFRDGKQRADWEAICRDYDSTNHQLRAARDLGEFDDDGGREPFPDDPAGAMQRLAEDDGRRSRDIPGRVNTGEIVDGEFVGYEMRRGRSPVEDRSVRAWALAMRGRQVPYGLGQSAQHYGLSTYGPNFELRLNAGQMPTLGLQLSRRAERRALGSHSLGSGGALVPETLAGTLEVAMKSIGPMLETSTVQVTPRGEPMYFAQCDDTSQTGSQVGENTDHGSTEVAFTRRLMNAYTYTTGVVRVANELIEDEAVNLPVELGRLFGTRIGRIINEKATNGNGAATFFGLLPSAKLGVTAESASTIAFDELVTLFHSVDASWRTGPGVGWMFNDVTASVIRRLKDGEGNYLWQPATQEGMPGLLLGSRVWINNSFPSIGSGNKSVAFGRLSQYQIRLVGRIGITFKQLDERYAEFNQTGFIGIARADGALSNPGNGTELCPVKYLQH